MSRWSACGVRPGNERRAQLAPIRERFKVGHVEGSGAATFHAHALEDVGALLAMVESFDSAEYEKRLEDLRRELAAAEDERERALTRAEERDAAERVARALVDTAIGKLREVFP